MIVIVDFHYAKKFQCYGLPIFTAKTKVLCQRHHQYIAQLTFMTQPRWRHQVFALAVHAGGTCQAL